MDLTLSEEQELLRKSARDVLAKECPSSVVRQMEFDALGYPPQLWRRMTELGWMGLGMPPAYGGEGTFLDLCILIEELGRAMAPVPFRPTVVDCGRLIIQAGSEEQKRLLLPSIIKGERIMSLAFLEPNLGYEAGSVTLSAQARGAKAILDGTKIFVPFAHVANSLICVARTRRDRNPRNGVSAFLVEAKTPGVKINPIRTMAEDRQSEVIFRRAGLPGENLIGPLHQAWPSVARTIEFAAAAQCVELVGIIQKVREMATDYAKERTQFGRPIGSFQAVQWRCVDMLCDVEGSRYATYQAAWRLSEGLPATWETAIAKAWTCDAASRVAQNGHQVIAAIGFTDDHDMQLFSRRIKVAEVNWGDAAFYREVMAKQYIGKQGR